MYYYRKTNQVTNALNVLGVLVFFYILMEAEIKKAAEEGAILGQIQGQGAGMGGARGPSTG